jgi:hypothetical protein
MLNKTNKAITNNGNRPLYDTKGFLIITSFIYRAIGTWIPARTADLISAIPPNSLERFTAFYNADNVLHALVISLYNTAF